MRSTRQQVEQTSAEVSNLRVTVQELQKQRSRANETHEIEISNLQKVVEMGKAEDLAKQRTIEAFSRERDEHGDRANTIELKIERLAKEKNHLAQLLQQKTEEANAIHAVKDLELSKQGIENDRLEEAKDRLEKERERLERRNESLEKDRESLEKKNENPEMQKRSFEIEKQSLHNNNQCLEEDNQRLGKNEQFSREAKESLVSERHWLLERKRGLQGYL